MIKDLVTVVIPVYDHEEFVIDSIESLLNQDYPHIELIVINDGSTDNTDKVIRKFLESNGPRFKYISKNNEGQTKTVQLGLEQSSGEFFCEFCSDDIMFHNSITSLVTVLKDNPDVDLVSADFTMKYINCDTNDDLSSVNSAREGFDSSKHTFKDMLINNINLVIPSSLIRTKKFKELNGFNTKFLSEDIFLKYLFALRLNCKYLDKTVFEYRQHGTNISKDNPWWLRMERITVLEEIYNTVKESSKFKEIIFPVLVKDCIRNIRHGKKLNKHKKELIALRDCLKKYKPTLRRKIQSHILLVFY